LDIGVQSDSSSDSSSSSSSSGSSSEESDNDDHQEEEENDISHEQSCIRNDESDSNHVQTTKIDTDKNFINKSVHEDADEHLNSSIKKRKLDQDTNCNVKDTNFNRELTTNNAKNYK
jgi:hypothetical protein